MRHLIAVLCLIALPAIASANILSYTGSLDPNNPDDVFITSFSIAAGTSVPIQTYGYGGAANAPGGTNAAHRLILVGGFAENLGTGTLGDGFIGLQGSYYDAASNAVRTSNYAIDIGSADGHLTAITPEPGSASMFNLAACTFAVLIRRRKTVVP